MNDDEYGKNMVIIDHDWLAQFSNRKPERPELAHSCAIFLFYLGGEI